MFVFWVCILQRFCFLQQLDFMRRLEEFIYGVQFKYDTNGRNICALELSKFLQTHNFLTNENVNKTKTVMESDEDLNKREFLQNLLKAIIRSYRVRNHISSFFSLPNTFLFKWSYCHCWFDFLIDFGVFSVMWMM